MYIIVSKTKMSYSSVLFVLALFTTAQAYPSVWYQNPDHESCAIPVEANVMGVVVTEGTCATGCCVTPPAIYEPSSANTVSITSSLTSSSHISIGIVTDNAVAGTMEYSGGAFQATCDKRGTVAGQFQMNAGTETVTWNAPVGGNVTFSVSCGAGYGEPVYSSEVVSMAKGGATAPGTVTQTTTTLTTVKSDIDVPRDFTTSNSIVVGSDGEPTLYLKHEESRGGYLVGLLVPTGYRFLAVGFQESGVSTMSGNQIATVYLENGVVKCDRRRAEGRNFPGVSSITLQDVETKKTDTNLQCVFFRPYSIGNDWLNWETDDLQARIMSNEGDFGAFEKHNIPPSASTVGVLPSVANGNIAVAANTFKFATKGNIAHGAIMILAWMLLSPIGTIFARYAKHIGGRNWFLTHRTLQASAVGFTILGLIFIASAGVEFDQLQDDSLKHAQMGIAVVALAIFQALIGFFRKLISNEKEETVSDEYPHGPNRYIFNWLHKINGTVLFGLSLATIHLGITLFKDQAEALNEADLWIQEPAEDLFYAYIGVFVGFAIILEILFAPKWGAWGPLGDNSLDDSEDSGQQQIRTIVVSIMSAFAIGVSVAMWAIMADTQISDDWSA
eukprot:m.36600 g.36600  ORF g.36600 m.36600 type:complete len:614 (-) comp9156_c0_seq1:1321-3162(-)